MARFDWRAGIWVADSSGAWTPQLAQFPSNLLHAKPAHCPMREGANGTTC